MKKILTKEKFTLIGFLLYFLLYFYFILNSGFSSDDSYNAHFRGHLVDERTTLWDYYVFHFLQQIQGSGGRLSFVAILYNTGLYYLTQSTYIIKTLGLLIFSSTVVSFYYYLKHLTKSKDFALLTITLIPLFFQIRPWHDPIIAFTFLFPLVFLLVLLSLLLFQNSLKNHRFSIVFLSCFLYLLACFMYEIAYFLFPLFFLTAFNENKSIKFSLKKSFPQMSIGILAISWVLFYKYFGGEDNWRTNPEFSNDFFYALFYQITSSFPLSFWFFNAEWSSLKFKYFDILLIIITPLFLFFNFKNIFSKKKANFSSLIIIVLIIILWVFPALITALSGHQKELKSAGIGFGYLPVFFQYFGTCLFFSFIIYKFVYKIFNKNINNIKCFILILFPLFVINYTYNQDVALSGDVVFKHPRQLLISALKLGLLDKVKESDIIFRPGYYPSDYYTGYYSVLGIRVNMCDTRFLPTFEKNSGDFDKCFEDGFGNGPTFSYERKNNYTILNPIHNAWFVSYEYEKKGRDGYVYFAKIDRIIVEEGETMKILAVPSSVVNVYHLKTNSIHKLNIPVGKKIDVNKFSVNRALVYSKRNPRKPINIKDYFYDEIEYSWGGTVYPLEGTIDANLRWTSGQAELKIFNLSDNKEKVNYSFTISSPTGRDSVITINNKEYKLIAGTHLLVSDSVLVGKDPYVLDIFSDDLPIDNGDPRNIVFGIHNYKQWLDKDEISKEDRLLIDSNAYIDNQLEYSWSESVYPREGTPEDNLRWTNGQAELKIFNLANEKKKVNYSFSIGSPTGRDSIITINDKNYKLTSGALLSISDSVLIGSEPYKLEIYSDDTPIDNGDPRNIVFSIHNYKQWLDDQLEYSWSESVYPREGTPEDNLRWTSGQAELKIFNLSDNKEKVNYSFTISSPTGRDSVITINNKEYKLIAGTHLLVSDSVLVGKDPYVLDIFSDDLPIDNGDPRNIVFGIHNYKQWVKGNSPIKENLANNDNKITKIFASGWHDDEKTHRWSSQRNSTIYLNNYFLLKKNFLLSFKLDTEKRNSVKLVLNGKVIRHFDYLSQHKQLYVEPFKIELSSGINTLEFISGVEPSLPENGDHRKLGIALSDFNVIIKDD